MNDTRRRRKMRTLRFIDEFDEGSFPLASRFLRQIVEPELSWIEVHPALNTNGLDGGIRYETWSRT
jgi:hypothetical protein